MRTYGFDNPRKRHKDKIMKKHYLTALLFLFYVGNAAALPDCPSSGYFDNCYGAYEWDTGDKYVGEWKDDKRHGYGTNTYAEGEKYVGEYKDGKKHGQGTYTYAEGDKYVGEYKDGKAHGQGTYTYASDDKYVGEYKDGKKHGQDTYTYADGTAKRGYFSNDELVFDICEGEGLIKASDEFTTTKGFDEFITVANAFFDYYAQCVFKLMDD